MDNLDDSENNAKISDSAYSNSCSNSQSRRSHSSKSTHSGSNSSGSSGYGGKPSTSGYSSNNNQLPEKRQKDKENKKKKSQTINELTTTEEQTLIASNPPAPAQESEPPKEDGNDLSLALTPTGSHGEKGEESMEISNSDRTSCKDETGSGHTPLVTTLNIVANRPASGQNPDSFSCVISMHNGVVMYTTTSITSALGYPKEMWIGRSFLDFVHLRDRNIFASQITSGLAAPKNVNGMIKQAPTQLNSTSTIVCRLRRYRGLTTGFGVKERNVSFVPFLLKLSFKNICDEEGEAIYLVIQATPFYSAFKVPNEVIVKAVPFVIRHAANGTLEYIDPESVPYLGFLPQDLVDKDALQLYHPQDLDYLQHVYETIVREGGVSRSNAYRMVTQNGDYVTLETEWSSFINPWSRKLEFVIGKHHIVEGPRNPDVFQLLQPEKKHKANDDVKIRAQAKRESIIRIMNEVLTKPAQAAKQQMTKRCQDLASFMESLMDETPKTDDDLHLEIQDADPYGTPGLLAARPFSAHSPNNTGPVQRPLVSDERPALSKAFQLSRHEWERTCHRPKERDSVMLGGISPHHDCNDSKSSTETPISYNQLNYNETLQRYFDSHQPYTFEELNTGENIVGINDPKAITGHCMSQNSGDSADMGSSCDSNAITMASASTLATLDYKPVRLTESLIDKHNAEMEKELLKMHREQRSSSKSVREKSSIEKRQKKKEHLARCNASYEPTTAGLYNHLDSQAHGVKRSSKLADTEPIAHKHHCSSQRQSRCWQPPISSTPPPPLSIPSSNMPMMAGMPTTSAWPQQNGMNGMNTFFVGVGIPQQMSIVSPVAAVPGMFPMYYAPTTATMVNSSQPKETSSINTNPQYQQPPMQCMMYGQALYGSPFMYSPIQPQVSYAVPQNYPLANQHFTDPNHSVGLGSNNYEEACKSSVPPKMKSFPESSWRDKRMTALHGDSPNTNQQAHNCSAEVSNRPQSGKSAKRKLEISSDIVSADSFSPKIRIRHAASTSTEVVADKGGKDTARRGSTNDDIIDKTDGESSYSSFYSSFFKTDSGSAEDSDIKKTANKYDSKGEDLSFMTSGVDVSGGSFDPQKQVKKMAKRKMEPPWMEQVCVTSELIYRYQVLTKSMEEVLTCDKQRMKNVEQPSLVNEQLSQLYLDLQLEGVAARLTLEEGITSSSSSGEETNSKSSMGKFSTQRKKREYAKLVMIYEEDAPLPSPSDDAASSLTT